MFSRSPNRNSSKRKFFEIIKNRYQREQLGELLNFIQTGFLENYQLKSTLNFKLYMKISSFIKRKGDSELKDQKEKVPILKDESEIKSVKDYTSNSFNDGWKYLYGIDPTNKTFVKDNLVIKKTNDGSAYEIELDNVTLKVSGMPFIPFFSSAKDNIMVTLDYYREYLGDKTLVLICRLFNVIQWVSGSIERYKNKITLLEGDFEQIVNLINNMTTTTIDLDTVDNFYDINKAIVEGVYKPYVTRVSIIELFNLYKTVRGQLPQGCYRFLYQTVDYPFKRNGVDLEISSDRYSDYNNAYLSYYVPQGREEPYRIWFCNEYKVLPDTFTDKDKTIEFEENGEIKEYYKVIMVKKVENENTTYYPMLYFDWGDYDVEKIIKFDPESIEPKKLRPATYYFYMKYIFNHMYGISNWIINGNNEPESSNNQHYNFGFLLNDYKDNFDSSEVYTLYKIQLYLYDYILKVGNYLIENIETIKTFYPQQENESYGSYIARITGRIVALSNNELVIYQSYNFDSYREKFNLLGTFNEGTFIYNPENVGSNSSQISSYVIQYFSYLIAQYFREVEKPESHKPYIESIDEYTPVMVYLV